MQFSITISSRTYQAILSMFHIVSNTCFTLVCEFELSLLEMKMVSGLPILGSVYEEYVLTESHLRSLQTENPALGQMMSFLLNG